MGSLETLHQGTPPAAALSNPPPKFHSKDLSALHLASADSDESDTIPSQVMPGGGDFDDEFGDFDSARVVGAPVTTKPGMGASPFVSERKRCSGQNGAAGEDDDFRDFGSAPVSAKPGMGAGPLVNEMKQSSGLNGAGGEDSDDCMEFATTPAVQLVATTQPASSACVTPAGGSGSWKESAEFGIFNDVPTAQPVTSVTDARLPAVGAGLQPEGGDDFAGFNDAPAAQPAVTAVPGTGRPAVGAVLPQAEDDDAPTAPLVASVTGTELPTSVPDAAGTGAATAMNTAAAVTASDEEAQEDSFGDYVNVPLATELSTTTSGETDDGDDDFGDFDSGLAAVPDLLASAATAAAVLGTAEDAGDVGEIDSTAALAVDVPPAAAAPAPVVHSILADADGPLGVAEEDKFGDLDVAPDASASAGAKAAQEDGTLDNLNAAAAGGAMDGESKQMSVHGLKIASATLTSVSGTSALAWHDQHNDGLGDFDAAVALGVGAAEEDGGVGDVDETPPVATTVTAVAFSEKLSGVDQAGDFCAVAAGPPAAPNASTSTDVAIACDTDADDCGDFDAGPLITSVTATSCGGGAAAAVKNNDDGFGEFDTAMTAVPISATTTTSVAMEDKVAALGELNVDSAAASATATCTACAVAGVDDGGDHDDFAAAGATAATTATAATAKEDEAGFGDFDAAAPDTTDTVAAIPAAVPATDTTACSDAEAEDDDAGFGDFDAVPAVATSTTTMAATVEVDDSGFGDFNAAAPATTATSPDGELEDDADDFGNFDAAHPAVHITIAATMDAIADVDDFGDFDATPPAAPTAIVSGTAVQENLDDLDAAPLAAHPRTAATAAVEDDVDEFGDFDEAPPSAATPITAAAAQDDNDDFGDFGAAPEAAVPAASAPASGLAGPSGFATTAAAAGAGSLEKVASVRAGVDILQLSGNEFFAAVEEELLGLWNKEGLACNGYHQNQLDEGEALLLLQLRHPSVTPAANHWDDNTAPSMGSTISSIAPPAPATILSSNGLPLEQRGAKASLFDGTFTPAVVHPGVLQWQGTRSEQRLLETLALSDIAARARAQLESEGSVLEAPGRALRPTSWPLARLDSSSSRRRLKTGASPLGSPTRHDTDEAADPLALSRQLMELELVEEGGTRSGSSTPLDTPLDPFTSTTCSNSPSRLTRVTYENDDIALGSTTQNIDDFFIRRAPQQAAGGHLSTPSPRDTLKSFTAAPMFGMQSPPPGEGLDRQPTLALPPLRPSSSGMMAAAATAQPLPLNSTPAALTSVSTYEPPPAWSAANPVDAPLTLGDLVDFASRRTSSTSATGGCLQHANSGASSSGFTQTSAAAASSIFQLPVPSSLSSSQPSFSSLPQPSFSSPLQRIPSKQLGRTTSSSSRGAESSIPNSEADGDGFGDFVDVPAPPTHSFAPTTASADRQSSSKTLRAEHDGFADFVTAPPLTQPQAAMLNPSQRCTAALRCVPAAALSHTLFPGDDMSSIKANAGSGPSSMSAFLEASGLVSLPRGTSGFKDWPAAGWGNSSVGSGLDSAVSESGTSTESGLVSSCWTGPQLTGFPEVAAGVLDPAAGQPASLPLFPSASISTGDESSISCTTSPKVFLTSAGGGVQLEVFTADTVEDNYFDLFVASYGNGAVPTPTPPTAAVSPSAAAERLARVGLAAPSGGDSKDISTPVAASGLSGMMSSPGLDKSANGNNGQGQEGNGEQGFLQPEPRSVNDAVGNFLFSDLASLAGLPSQSEEVIVPTSMTPRVDSTMLAFTDAIPVKGVGVAVIDNTAVSEEASTPWAVPAVVSSVAAVSSSGDDWDAFQDAPDPPQAPFPIVGHISSGWGPTRLTGDSAGLTGPCLTGFGLANTEIASRRVNSDGAVSMPMAVTNVGVNPATAPVGASMQSILSGVMPTGTVTQEGPADEDDEWDAFQATPALQQLPATATAPAAASSSAMHPLSDGWEAMLPAPSLSSQQGKSATPTPSFTSDSAASWRNETHATVTLPVHMPGATFTRPMYSAHTHSSTDLPMPRSTVSEKSAPCTIDDLPLQLSAHAAHDGLHLLQSHAPGSTIAPITDQPAAAFTAAPVSTTQESAVPLTAAPSGLAAEVAADGDWGDFNVAGAGEEAYAPLMPGAVFKQVQWPDDLGILVSSTGASSVASARNVPNFSIGLDMGPAMPSSSNAAAAVPVEAAAPAAASVPVAAGLAATASAASIQTLASPGLHNDWDSFQPVAPGVTAAGADIHAATVAAAPVASIQSADDDWDSFQSVTPASSPGAMPFPMISAATVPSSSTVLPAAAACAAIVTTVTAAAPEPPPLPAPEAESFEQVADALFAGLVEMKHTRTSDPPKPATPVPMAARRGTVASPTSATAIGTLPHVITDHPATAASARAALPENFLDDEAFVRYTSPPAKPPSLAQPHPTVLAKAMHQPAIAHTLTPPAVSVPHLAATTSRTTFSHPGQAPGHLSSPQQAAVPSPHAADPFADLAPPGMPPHSSPCQPVQPVQPTPSVAHPAAANLGELPPPMSQPPPTYAVPFSQPPLAAVGPFSPATQPARPSMGPLFPASLAGTPAPWLSGSSAALDSPSSLASFGDFIGGPSLLSPPAALIPTSYPPSPGVPVATPHPPFHMVPSQSLSPLNSASGPNPTPLPRTSSTQQCPPQQFPGAHHPRTQPPSWPAGSSSSSWPAHPISQATAAPAYPSWPTGPSHPPTSMHPHSHQVSTPYYHPTSQSHPSSQHGPSRRYDPSLLVHTSQPLPSSQHAPSSHHDDSSISPSQITGPFPPAWPTPSQPHSPTAVQPHPGSHPAMPYPLHPVSVHLGAFPLAESFAAAPEGFNTQRGMPAVGGFAHAVGVNLPQGPGDFNTPREVTSPGGFASARGCSAPGGMPGPASFTFSGGFEAAVSSPTQAGDEFGDFESASSPHSTPALAGQPGHIPAAGLGYPARAGTCGWQGAPDASPIPAVQRMAYGGVTGMQAAHGRMYGGPHGTGQGRGWPAHAGIPGGWGLHHGMHGTAGAPGSMPHAGLPARPSAPNMQPGSGWS